MGHMKHLESWYASMCDGDWEHEYGIRLETVDNPGWDLTVDISETDLEGMEISLEILEFPGSRWMWVAGEVMHQNTIYEATVTVALHVAAILDQPHLTVGDFDPDAAAPSRRPTLVRLLEWLGDTARDADDECVAIGERRHGERFLHEYEEMRAFRDLRPAFLAAVRPFLDGIASRAVVTTLPDGGARTEQGGPGRVFDAFETAWDGWTAHGNINRWDHGITIPEHERYVREGDPDAGRHHLPARVPVPA
ncbi:Imm53 family immunity protein [Embleya sp. NPDC008237]|uniref:Imm53 family immunity protein n=1 Tax=Embleya sp. NPDC008237 TaxID=3363978 RepID=UPI0036EFB644